MLRLAGFVMLLGPKDFANVRIMSMDGRGNGSFCPLDSNIWYNFNLTDVVAAHRSHVVEGSVASVDSRGLMVMHNVYSGGK